MAPRPNPYEHKGRDWNLIRREWETTDISDVQLAKRHGMTSNAVRSHRIKDGWIRNVDAVAANLVTRAVAATARAKDTASPVRASQCEGASPPALADAKDVCESECESFASRSRNSPRQERILAQEAAHEAEDKVRLTQAQDLATIQAEAITEQLDLADRAILVAKAMLDHMNHLMGSDPMLMMEAQRRFMSINPDKDTIATITKSMAQLAEVGVKIKRAALGMDLVKKLEDGAIDPTRPPEQVDAVMRKLPAEALLAFRQAAIELGRQRSAGIMIEGTVE